MINPTVGRKVWYSPEAGEGGVKLGEQPFDATVVFVHNERMVNLLIVDHAGNGFSKHSVTLLQDDDAPLPQGGHASWMPYQVGQAKAAVPPEPTPEPVLVDADGNIVDPVA